MAPTGAKKSKPKQPRKLSVEELVQAAEHAVTVSDPRHAVTLYTVAIQKAADRPSVLVDLLEKRAEVHVSLQNQDAALRDYQAALANITKTTGVVYSIDGDNINDQQQQIMLDTLERTAALHMYIGQLNISTDALESYQQGIDCLQNAITVIESAAPDTVIFMNKNCGPQLNQQLAAAYCSMAELYLTDLCYQDDAETKCETCLQQALQLVPESTDALQTMASLRFSQNRGLEALPYMMRVYATMQTGCQALAALVGLRGSSNTDDEDGGATELVAIESAQNLPGFEFRCQTAKLLLECAGTSSSSTPPLAQPPAEPIQDDSLSTEQKQQQQRSEYAQAAIDVLGSLLAENDEVVEVWTLLGDAFEFLDPHDGSDEQQQPQSCQYWERALEMLTAVQESIVAEQQDMDDDDDDEIQQQLDQVVCQMEDLRAKLEEARGDDAMAE